MPPATASFAACSAARSASARSRSPDPSRTLRLDSASPSGSRTVATDLDAHRDVEVAHQPPDDGELLAVLLAEVRDVRRGHVQQLQHDGGDALEVDRAAMLALEPGAGPATFTDVAKPAG